jgi:hypothetical protein
MVMMGLEIRNKVPFRMFTYMALYSMNLEGK